MTLQQINSLAPNLQMARYLDATGAPRPTVFNISNRDFFAQLNSLLESTPLQDWKVYLTWQLLYDAAPWLSSGFVQEDFSFRQALTGMKEAPPRWKRCVSAVDSSLGEVLGRVYIDETFTAYDKQRVLEIANALEKTLAHEISALNWLTPRTRDEALAKLASVRNKIGYPDAWHDYAALTIVRGDLLGNLRRAALFESKRQLHNIGRPTDKTEWAMSPSAVNAYYSPEFNEIVFPAGILQPPFFDRSLDQAANIGAIGFVIAHELTHGFDAKGWSFDSKGIRREWWPGEDKQQYKTRVKCISDEYSSFVAVDNQHLNGRLTLDENMADNRGAQLALIAFHAAIAEARANEDAKIDDRTNDQQFFLRFARVWCENSTPELSRLAVRADPHSPGRWRVNGVVRNMPEFQKAFGCKPGQPMAPQNACSVW
jgi:predicted metalloendopeptidase